VYRTENLKLRSWASLNIQEKLDLCNNFRSSTKFQAKFTQAEDGTDPWCSWFLLANAKKTLSTSESASDAESSLGQTSSKQGLVSGTDEVPAKDATEARAPTPVKPASGYLYDPIREG